MRSLHSISTLDIEFIGGKRDGKSVRNSAAGVEKCQTKGVDAGTEWLASIRMAMSIEHATANGFWQLEYHLLAHLQDIEKVNDAVPEAPPQILQKESN
jgi:hypothetical protein